MFSINNVVLTLSARVDSWKNYDGHIFETTSSTGLPTRRAIAATLPDRDDTVVSPRVAALYRISDRAVGVGRRRLWIPRADAERALSPVQCRSRRARWRMRTLGPERLFGGEAGVRLEPTRNVSIRSTWYDNGVKNPVANVTIGTNLQQRQNLGRTRIRGWQNDVESRLSPSLRLTGGYLFNNAKVTEFDANPGARRACICRRCRSTADRSAWRTRTRAT